MKRVKTTVEYEKLVIEKSNEIGVTKGDMQLAVNEMKELEQMYERMTKHFDSDTGVLDTKELLK